MKNAVLFDLFGTLVPSPPASEYRQMVDAVAKVLNLPPAELFGPWMEVNDHRLNGSFGSSEAEIEYAAGVFDVIPSESQMKECVDIRRNAVAGWMQPKPEAITTLNGLKGSGVNLALVSDCVYDVPAVWPNTDFAELFDVTVFSCEQGIRKPDRRMYEAALSKLQTETNHALFVGDGGSGELHGASALGIEAVLLDDLPPDADVLRVDVREWTGPVIGDLAEVFDLVHR